MRFCPNCQAPLRDGAAFCANCGARVEAASAPSGHPGLRSLVILAVAVVVLVAVGLGLVLGIPGTGFKGILGTKKSATSGVNNDPSAAAVKVAPSFANGYSQAWSVSLDDLGVYQDFANLGVTGYGNNVPTLTEINQTSSVAVFQSTFANGTVSSSSSILYGVDVSSGRKLWSTGEDAADASNCSAAAIDGAIYCVDGIGGGTGSGLHIFSVQTADGTVGASGPGIFEPSNLGQTNGASIGLPYAESLGPGDWQEGAGGSVSIVAAGKDLFIGAQGNGCDDLVSRIDPSSLKTMWTAELDGGNCDGMGINPVPFLVQGDVVITGVAAPSAIDIATGKVLYSSETLGFSGPDSVFAMCWDGDVCNSGASSFSDSTGVSWKVARVVNSGISVDFSGSHYGLPLQVGLGSVTSFELLADQSVGGGWQSPTFNSGDYEYFAGSYDGQRLLVAGSDGTLYFIDPSTGKFIWQAVLPVPPASSTNVVASAPCVALLSDSTALVQVGSGDGAYSIALVDLSNGGVIWTINGPETVDFAILGQMGSVDGLHLVNPQSPDLAMRYITPGVPQPRVDSMPSEIASCPDGWTPVSWSTWTGNTPGHTLVCSTSGRATFFVLVVVNGTTYWTDQATPIPTGGYAAIGDNWNATIALGGGLTYWTAGGKTTSYVASQAWSGVPSGFTNVSSLALPDCPSGSYPISLSVWSGQWLLTCGTSPNVVTQFIYVDSSGQHNGGAMDSQGTKLCGNDNSGVMVCQTAGGVSIGSQYYPSSSSWLPGFGQTNIQSGASGPTGNSTQTVQPPGNAGGYSTYNNGRYQYSVDYPNALVANQPPTDNDGQSWTSPDGTITYVVWGENVVNETPADLVASNTAYAAQGMTLTYSDSGVAADGSSWMVKSGVSADGATSFYCFSTSGFGSAVTMSWVWPTSQTQVKDWIDHAYASLMINGVAIPH